MFDSFSVTTVNPRVESSSVIIPTLLLLFNFDLNYQYYLSHKTSPGALSGNRHPGRTHTEIQGDLRSLYDRTPTARHQWNQGQYMRRVCGWGGWGDSGSSQERLWCLAIFRPPLPYGPATVESRQACAQTAVHASVQAPTSHLHGTRWCWECDVRPDSSERRGAQLSLHQSYSATQVAPETTPREERQRETINGAAEHHWRLLSL